VCTRLLAQNSGGMESPLPFARFAKKAIPPAAMAQHESFRMLRALLVGSSCGFALLSCSADTELQRGVDVGNGAGNSGGSNSDSGGNSGLGTGLTGSTGTGGSAGSGGSTGSGGLFATGGTSGTPDICADRIVLAQPNIIDFETADPQNPDSMDYLPSGAWVGGAYGYQDDFATPTDPVPADRTEGWAVKTPGHDSANALALELSFYQWGGGLGVWMQGCYDVDAFDGIEFWAKEGFSHTVTVSVATKETIALADGGSCTAFECKPHVKDIALTPDWALYRVSWSELVSPTVSGPPNTAEINRLNFQINNQKTYDNPADPDQVDFWLDDISLFSGGAGGGGG
jgi:hypothetical protein